MKPGRPSVFALAGFLLFAPAARPGVPIAGEDESNDVLTAIVGLAIAEIISPGITSKW